MVKVRFCKFFFFFFLSYSVSLYTNENVLQTIGINMLFELVVYFLRDTLIFNCNSEVI